MSEMPDNGVAAPHLHRETVRPEWIDYNGHMNVAYYTLLFDHAGDAFVESAGLTAAHRERTGGSIFAVEAHITYARELAEGDPVRVETQLIGLDAKRIHLFQRMLHDGRDELCATYEVMDLYVDLNQRRVAPMPDKLHAAFAALKRRHDALGRPEEAGRAVQSPKAG
jgi:acyl-CoA thioester hydrolase